MSNIHIPASIKSFVLRVTEPSPAITNPLERHNARLIAGLLVLSACMMVTVLASYIILGTLQSEFDLIIFVLKLSIITLEYFLSRTRYFRPAILIGIAAVMVTIYSQSIYAGLYAPNRMTDSSVWAMGMILIGGLLVSWQAMVLLAVIYIAALVALPLYIPGLMLTDMQFTLEYAVGMTALITINALLRQRDMAQVQRQTQALSISEARYRTLLDAGFEAIIIHDNGLILDVNDATVRMVGFKAEELIGRRTIELVTPDSRPAVAKLYAERPPDNLSYETSFTHKDGRRLDAEVRSRMIEYKGQSVRVIAFRDITESKRVSDQIKNLFESLDRVFYSFDAVDTHMLQISAACEKITGFTAKEFYDDPAIWARLIHADDLPKFVENFRRINHERHEFHQVRIVCKDGTIRHVEILIIPVFNGANELTRFDGLITDVTDQLRIEAEKRELQIEHERSAVLRQFIDDASHDLRTPLATMYTSLYLLRRASPQDETLVRHLNTLESQTTHLARVINDLFTMSRLDAPSTYVEKQSLDIRMVMDTVVNSHRTQAEEKHQQLIYTPPLAPFKVNADKDYISDAINRIVKNAITYTPDSGTIRINVLPSPEHHITIEVIDTGIGLQPAELPNIFDRFYRSDKARKTNLGGVGLGLSLARKIIELHDGTITVESTPGAGSTFRITLPLMVK